MKIAILGAGKLGPVLAAGLLKAGHDVILYNQIMSETRTLIQMGAKTVMSPTEAINKSEVAIIVFSDGKQSKKILLENTDGRAFEGKAILEGSALDPKEILEMALFIAENGGRLSTLSIMADSEKLKSSLSDFVIGCSEYDQNFWTSLILEAMESFDTADERYDSQINARSH